MPNDFDSNIFINSYNLLSNIIKPYTNQIYNFVDAYERKLKGETKPEDETVISDFTNKLNEMPDEHRQLSLIFLRNQAKERGLDSIQTRGVFSGLADDFTKSFSRIYKQGFIGRGEGEIEKIYSKINSSGQTTTAIPIIDSLEAATKYVDEQTSQSLREVGAQTGEMIGTGTGIARPIENGVKRELSPDESVYIRQALKESRKEVTIGREIRNIGSVLDPVADNWSGLMAGTLGSSAAILLPLAISGPGGGALATEMYRGMEYNNLMSKYPDMDPNSADSIALVSGAIQGALDFAEVGLLKNLGGKLAKKFAPGIAGASVEGVYIGDAILADLGLTYAFENVVEGVQDFTTPVVQEVFSRFDNAVPEVKFGEELKEWISTRPDVAIGMIPLTIFGGAASAGAKLYSNSRLLREASDIERLTDAGIVESDRLTLSKMVENRDVEGIRTFLPEAWSRRDSNLIESRVAEKLNNRLLSLNAAASLNAAIQAGAIPNFSVNERGQYLVEGVENPFNTREEVMGYISGRISEINDVKSRIITESVRDVEKTTTDLNISSDPIQLDSENDSLSKLNGLPQNKVNELNNAFGDKVQQDRVFKQVVNDIFTGKQTAETALKEYINGVYNNLPTTTKDSLGVDETSGKQALFDLVTMRKDKVEVVNRPSLKESNVLDSMYQNKSFNKFSIQNLSNIQNILSKSIRFIPAGTKISDAQQDTLDIDALILNTMWNLPPGTVKMTAGIVTHVPNAPQKDIETIAAFNDFVSEFSKQFNVNVVFYEQTGKAQAYAGFYGPNTRTIFINYKTNLPFMVLYGHEFGHSLEFTDPTLYGSVRDELFDIAKIKNPDFLSNAMADVPEFYFQTDNIDNGAANKIEFLKYINDITQPTTLTKKQIIDIEKAVKSEIANDLIGLLFTDQKLFEELHNKDRDLFSKILYAIWDFTSNLLDFINNKILKIQEIGGQDILQEFYSQRNIQLNLSVAAYENMRSTLAEILYQYKLNLDRYPGVNRSLAGIGNITKGQTTRNFSASVFRPSTTTSSPNNEVLHVANKIRNTISSAKVLAEKARKRGDKTAGVAVEETISEMVSPINEESFNAAAKSRALNKETMESDTWLTRAKILKNSLRKALSNNDISLNALANAASVLNQTYSDVANLNEVDKLKNVANAIKELNSQLKAVYIEEMENEKVVFSELEKDYRNNGKTDIADMFKMYNEAFEETDPSGVVSQLFNELYTPNGVPVATDVKDYNDKLLKYNILKAIGNYQNMNADQLENLIKTLDSFIANVDSTTFVKELQNLVKNMQYISETSQSLEKRELDQFNKMNNVRQPIWSGVKKIFQPLTDMISSFSDSHLTFSSLIELVYPNNIETNKATYARIAELTEIVQNESLSDPERADANVELGILRESIGKAIVPEMQKVVDDLRNSYTDILIDNETNEEDLRKVIAKAFSLKSSAARVVNKKLYDLVDRKLESGKGFIVKINNRDYVLSQAYAGYILNLSDIGDYDVQLNDNGFSSDVITNIRKGISKEANQIRLELRKLIRKEHQKANESSLKKMGFGTIIPDENFFPVQYKSTTTAVIDAFDINFQGGITDKDSETILSSSGRDIELDLNIQSINMFSMFNSHMYLSTHKRNVTAPITVAKAVLADKQISERITAAFGIDFYQQLFKLLGALETNGVRTVEMSRTWRNYMRGLMSGAAKGALAMNPTTIVLNATSMFNTGLDSSIPLNRVISSYGRVLAATLSGNKLGIIPKTAKEIRNFNIIKQRISGGANSLLAMSKSDPTISKPNVLTEAGDFGMRPISLADGYFGSFAAAVAYDAHYRMAEESGLSPSEVEAAAEEGMKRTIQTTFQPNTVANKATVEVGSNIVMRMLGMFMSEARKAVGLEITAFKKNGLFSKEFGRFVIVNHFLIGGLSYLIRSAIKDALNDEKEDEDIWNPAQLAQNILIGPLSGLFILGTALESSGIWITNQLIDALDVKNEKVKADLGIIGEVKGKVKKLPVFPKDNVIASTAKQLQSVKDIFEEETFDESADAAINAGKGLGAILNNSAISGATTIAKTVKVIADAIDENIIDFMEEPKKK